VILTLRIFEKLFRNVFWVALVALIVMLLLALVKPSKDVPEDEP
jgi:hypothetical protein